MVEESNELSIDDRDFSAAILQVVGDQVSPAKAS